MAAVNYNFDIEKSSNFNLSFIYNNDGNPVDLSNKCVIVSLSGDDGSIRRYSSRALSNYETNGWSLEADNLGNIDLKLSAEETSTYNFSLASYDLDVKDADTIKLNNVRLAQGLINLISRNIPLSDLGCPTSLSSLIEIVTPVPTNTGIGPSPTNTPTSTETIDFCLPYDCGPIDLFSTVYNGSGLSLPDLSTVSGSVTVTNTGIISNVELAINKLTHNNPEDLIFLLAPPSGNKILLSANSKINNFNNNFSFMFSNKAASGQYLYNIENGQVCNIFDKRNTTNYNNENLNSSFDHLFGASITGIWNMIVRDTDPLGSGSFDSWKLILTYENSISE